MPNSEHIVTSYEDELIELARSISEMGGLVEKAISNATDALIRSDADLAMATVGKKLAALPRVQWLHDDLSRHALRSLYDSAFGDWIDADSTHCVCTKKNWFASLTRYT